LRQQRLLVFRPQADLSDVRHESLFATGSTLSWASSRLPEHDNDVVRGHGDALGQFEAVLGSEERHIVEAADAPGRVAALEIPVEGQVGGGRLYILKRNALDRCRLTLSRGIS